MAATLERLADDGSAWGRRADADNEGLAYSPSTPVLPVLAGTSLERGSYAACIAQGSVPTPAVCRWTTRSSTAHEGDSRRFRRHHLAAILSGRYDTTNASATADASSHLKSAAATP